jgi:hypothetical protein
MGMLRPAIIITATITSGRIKLMPDEKAVVTSEKT